MYHLLKIPRGDIKTTRLIRAQGKGESLESMYARLKPDIIFNANLFTFSDGWTTAAIKVDSQIIRAKSSVKYGYAICGKGPTIKIHTLGEKTFEEVAKDYDWAVESAPLLLPQYVPNQFDKSLADLKHARTAFGFDDSTSEWHIYVTDSDYKLTCPELAAELKKLGTTVALNLDGGGSSKVLVNGKAINKQGLREISCAIGIWLNKPLEDKSVKKKLLALDAGHGMKTPGKGVPEMREHEFNSAVVKYAKELAEHNGFEVLLTQPLFSDYDTPLITRTNLAKDKKADLLMSYHADASNDPNARGHWCFFWTGHEPSGRLAMYWDKHADVLMNQTLDRNYRESVPGTWSEFHMCREPVKHGIPSILMEHAFMTNKDDLKLLLNDDFRRKCAEVSIRAACDYFGMEFKPLKTETPIPQQPSNKFYRVQVGYFGVKENAERLAKELQSKGYQTIIKEEN